MESPLFATPVARQGPTSRLLKRRSERAPPEPEPRTPAPVNVSFAVPLSNRSLRRPQNRTLGMNDTTMVFEATSRFLARNMSTFIDADNTFNQTMRMGDAFPQLQSSENLFVDFLATISPESNGLEALDQVAELEDLVASHIIPLKNQRGPSQLKDQVIINLINEKNTWRMIGKLYHDRLSSPVESMELESDSMTSIVLQTSEKRIVERLFAREQKLRQAQCVVDWLEQNSRDDNDEKSNMEYFSEATVAWENTLSVLNKNNRPTGRSMVTSMDPDAPRRERLPLHDQDAQEEQDLLKTLFTLIRSGELDKAQHLCIKVGSPWRAATLEGWKLFHDPNYERDMGEEKLPVEGNKNRDIWKTVSWKLTLDESLPPFERALYSAMCGNVKQLLTVCRSWEDILWAYTKGMIDSLVETEIRDMSPKSFMPLPKEYWDNCTNLKAIFDLINASNDPKVKVEHESPYHVVQRCLITEDFAELFSKMDEWVEKDEYKYDPHLLRFLAHIVLVLRKLDTSRPDVASEDKGTQVLKVYASYLMITNRVQQVAWYVSQLPHDDQIEMYAEFLETVNIESDRRLALTLAIESDLPITQIKSRVVQNIFSLDICEDDDDVSNEQLIDRRKIDCIGWLLYDKLQLPEAMYQANALTRCFIASEKFESAKETWSSLPDDASQLVTALSLEMNAGDMDRKDVNTINEYLCWQIYFRAKDSFSDWFDHFHREKPIAPQLVANPSFTEKVAFEQRTKQYQRDLERWQAAQTLQANEAGANLNEVLTFGGGWLVDQAPMNEDDEDVQQRMREMDYLRRLCIPQIVLLLHSVLHTTEQFDRAIALADTIASEQYGLYEVYHQENLREFLSKIRESSLKAMETGNRDSLGWIIDEKSD